MPNIIFQHPELEQALDQICDALAAPVVYLIGIVHGGQYVADALQQRLQQRQCKVVRGNLDIGMYRDDWGMKNAHPKIHSSDIPFDVTEKNLWLIDDVLYTGRTIRAALNELFDFGRPASIQLAVLLDRGGRKLPIQANITGLQYHAEDDYSIKLVRQDKLWHIEQKEVA